MGLPVNRRKNVTYKRGRRIRLPDVPGVRREQPHWDAGRIVAGVDEVGRGAWAGPVTYAAVILPSDRRMYKLRDSKLLDPVRRRQLAARVHDFARAVSIGEATNAEIDTLGMSAAMQLAARRAVQGLEVRPEVLLLDGNWDFCADLETTNECIVHGDAHSASIAAASIVAKVTRDSHMAEVVAAEHPPYDFASNKGYPSPSHRAALAQHGPCASHRQTWAPLRELLDTTQKD
ncbi:ribonuclease HII [Euzebya tangerina]|uniref:ribonuclease HII n=1 Tax=Euzebya tangerina TaxID=591198 RepID=UPI000E3192D0|nr:ribonuclease HII [Euzebya tangerina]